MLETEIKVLDVTMLEKAVVISHCLPDFHEVMEIHDIFYGLADLEGQEGQEGQKDRVVRYRSIVKRGSLDLETRELTIKIPRVWQESQSEQFRSETGSESQSETGSETGSENKAMDEFTLRLFGSAQPDEFMKALGYEKRSEIRKWREEYILECSCDYLNTIVVVFDRIKGLGWGRSLEWMELEALGENHTEDCLKKVLHSLGFSYNSRVTAKSTSELVSEFVTKN